MKLFVKYMVSNRCKMAVKSALKELGLHFIFVDLGEVETIEELSAGQREQLNKELLKSGLELMDDKKAMLIEKIKGVIIEMVHFAAERPKINFSDFLSEKLHYDYTYLANLFPKQRASPLNTTSSPTKLNG